MSAYCKPYYYEKKTTNSLQNYTKNVSWVKYDIFHSKKCWGFFSFLIKNRLCVFFGGKHLPWMPWCRHNLLLSVLLPVWVADLGTRQSARCRVVASSSNREAMSFPWGTETRVKAIFSAAWCFFLENTISASFWHKNTEEIKYIVSVRALVQHRNWGPRNF